MHEFNTMALFALIFHEQIYGQDASLHAGYNKKYEILLSSRKNLSA
jgi:hypothetical protein